jgi:hypothetical protein
LRSILVTIHISQDLPDQLKYIALAHELAHYAIHFPIILAGRGTEQLSWLLPHAQCVYADEFERYFGEGTALEQQADLLAGHLLIPPQIRLAGTERWAVEVGGARPYAGDTRITSDEAAWRLLSEYFPERSSVDHSWRNYDEMRDQAERELAWARNTDEPGETTLYRMMLRAVLRRESPDADSESRDLVSSVHKFWDSVVNDSDLLAPCRRDHVMQTAA